MRSKMALPAILQRLPPDCRRIAIVPLGGGAAAFSVVAATNKTAEDLEMIQNVQRVMGASKAWLHYQIVDLWSVIYYRYVT
ncbi:hypothetical protein JOM56_001863 [Amanita muscaria]